MILYYSILKLVMNILSDKYNILYNLNSLFVFINLLKYYYFLTNYCLAVELLFCEV